MAAYLTSRGEVGSRGAGNAVGLLHQDRPSRPGCGAGCMPSSRQDQIPVPTPSIPFLVAAKLTPDTVLSHHTALEFHGRAYSVWTHLIYSASRPVGPLTFRSQVFRGARVSGGALPLREEARRCVDPPRARGWQYASQVWNGRWWMSCIARTCREAGRKPGARWNRLSSSTSIR